MNILNLILNFFLTTTSLLTSWIKKEARESCKNTFLGGPRKGRHCQNLLGQGRQPSQRQKGDQGRSRSSPRPRVLRAGWLRPQAGDVQTPRPCREWWGEGCLEEATSTIFPCIGQTRVSTWELVSTRSLCTQSRSRGPRVEEQLWEASRSLRARAEPEGCRSRWSLRSPGPPAGTGGPPDCPFRHDWSWNFDDHLCCNWYGSV